jgi:putative DNA primase/helicase
MAKEPKRPSKKELAANDANSSDVSKSRQEALQKIKEERSKLADSEDERILKFAETGESGDAHFYVSLFSGILAYDHAAGLWYFFSGHYWVRCKIGEPLAMLEVLIDEYEKLAEKWSWRRRNATKRGDNNEAQKSKEAENLLLRKIGQLRRRRYRQDVLKLATAGKDSLGISGDEWDLNSDYLPCINGVLEITPGTFRDGRWQDFIKVYCPTAWQSFVTPHEKFKRFILEIMGYDQELADYLQRLLGSAITGRVEEHILAIFWGASGRNGKTVLLEILSYVLGELAGPAEAEMILVQKYAKSASAPSPELKALRGKRLVWCSETDEGRRLNAGKTKWLCGGDTIIARGTYDKRSIEFKPSHSLFLVTNFRPVINPQDEALWDRIHLVSFPIKFVDNPKGDKQAKRIDKFEEILKEEASGILAWLLEGYYQYKEKGLSPPPSVLSSTKEYHQAEDSIALFLEESCILGDTLIARAEPLFEAYQNYCTEEGFKPRGKRKFFLIIHSQFSRDRDGKGRYYIGLSLKDS